MGSHKMPEHKPLDYESLPPARKTEYSRSKGILGTVAAFGFALTAIHLTRESFIDNILAIGACLIGIIVFTHVAIGVIC